METKTKGSYIYLQLPATSAGASALDRELASRLMQIFGSRLVGHAVDLCADAFAAERVNPARHIIRTVDGFPGVSRFLDNFFFSRYRGDRYKSVYNLAFRKVEVVHMPNVFGITEDNFLQFSRYIDEETLVRSLRDSRGLSSQVIYDLLENDVEKEKMLERFPLEYEILRTF